MQSWTVSSVLQGVLCLSVMLVFAVFIHVVSRSVEIRLLPISPPPVVRLTAAVVCGYRWADGTLTGDAASAAETGDGREVKQVSPYNECHVPVHFTNRTTGELSFITERKFFPPLRQQFKDLHTIRFVEDYDLFIFITDS